MKVTKGSTSSKGNVYHSKDKIKIKEGMKFDNWMEVVEWKKKLEESQGFRYSSKNSKTVDLVNLARAPDRKIKKELVYYRNEFICVQGGKYKPKGEGVRKRKSGKCGCPAKFILLATRDGKYLQLQEGLNMQHNHKNPNVDDDGNENDGNKSLLESIREADEGCSESAQLDIPYVIHNPESSPRALAQTSIDEAGDDQAADGNLSQSFKDLSLSWDQAVQLDPVGHSSDIEKSIDAANHSAQEETEESENEQDEGASKPTIPISSSPQPTIYNLVDEAIEDDEIEVDDIVLSSKGKSRGRPKTKTKTTTVIGRKIAKGKLLPFKERSAILQVEMLLGLMFQNEITQSILKHEYKVQIDNLLHVKMIPDPFMDDDVRIEILQDFFDPKAYALLKKQINQKKKRNTYHCRKCEEEADVNCVQCDGCKFWLHFDCGNYDQEDEPELWYCQFCQDVKLRE